MSKRCGLSVWCAVLLGLSTGVAQAANIVVLNNDGPGEGFNDSTPADPVGGNPGTTLGEQRFNALQFAADLLGDRLGSSVTISIDAEFNPQECTRASATLAAAGTTTLVADFPNAPRRDTFYPIALANALAREDLNAGPEIGATFNSSIDNNPLCLGSGLLNSIDWYYGFDDEPTDNDLNFISTAVHEIVHGLGFATFTNLNTGQFAQDSQGARVKDIYAVFLFDLTMGAIWPELTAPQRAASASNDGNLVWNGPSSISNGVPSLDSPTGVNGENGGRIQLFAPAPSQPGSSVSHWDVELAPNALMEPFDTDDVFVTQGVGLTTCLLQDIGWTLINNTRCPNGDPVSREDGDDDPTDTQEGEPPQPGGTGNAEGSSGGNNGGGGSGGGGCVLANGTPDPLFPLLLLFAATLMYRRRTVARSR